MRILLSRTFLAISKRMASIIAPSSSAVDEAISISVTNLESRQNVAIVAQATRNDVTLSSFANYQANETGRVDLTQFSAMEGGSYEGVEPMGLFWSSEMTSHVKIPFRMLNGNDLDKWTYNIHVLDGHRHSLKEAVTVTGQLAQTNIDRLFLPSGVRRFNVYYGKLRGALFLPEGDGPFPAVIDVFGGANGLVAYRGGLFARHGYACLCIAYATYADLPKKIDKIEFDYFKEGIDFLKKHPLVDENNIGAYGSCLGGTVVMSMALCSSDIKAVAAVSPEVFAGTFDYHLKLDPTSDKTTVVPGLKWKLDMMKERDGAYDVRPVIFPSLENVDWRHHSFNYGRVEAPILFFYGSDDQFFELDFMEPVLKEQLENKKNAEVITYPGAGHIIQPPFMPLFAKYFSPAFGLQVWFGGRRVKHARAQEKMWRQTLDFFQSHLFPKKTSKL